MYLSLHAKYLLLLPVLNETRIFSTIFENSSNIKFHKILSNGSRVVPYGQTDMTKLIVSFAILQTHLKMQSFTTKHVGTHHWDLEGSIHS